MWLFGKSKKRKAEEQKKRELELQAKIEQEKVRLKEQEIKAQVEKAEKPEPDEKKSPESKPKAIKTSAQKQPAPKTKTSEKKSPTGKYEIYPEAGMYKYRLKASNGEILAVSFGYSTKNGAASGIETFKKNVKTGVFELLTDKSDYSFYTLFNSTGARAIVIGEFYDNYKQAESAVESVKKFFDTNKIIYLEKIPESEVREETVEKPKVELNANGKYEIFEEKKYWFVRLRASNGESLFTSQAYSSKASALSGLETIKQAVDDFNFTVAKDKQNRYQFKLYSSRKQIILSGETYPVKRSCLSAIESVVRFSSKAKIVEL